MLGMHAQLTNISVHFYKKYIFIFIFIFYIKYNYYIPGNIYESKN